MSFDDCSETGAIAVAALLVPLIGYCDYLSGVELRIFPLYFVPIAIVSWQSNRIAAGLTALLCGIVWLGSNLGAGMSDSSHLITVANFFVMLLAFWIVAWLTSSNRAALKREQRFSRHDMLTGLLNSRGLHERAATEIARVQRAGGNLTIALLDLDKFKEVNDTHGHAAGDLVLTEMGNICGERLRRTDVAARLGGDEFVLLMPDTDADGASIALDNIRRSMAEAAAARGLPITVTIGACTFRDVPGDIDALLRKADETMYKAKRAGRNCVMVDAITNNSTDFVLRGSARCHLPSDRAAGHLGRAAAT